MRTGRKVLIIFIISFSTQLNTGLQLFAQPKAWFDVRDFGASGAKGENATTAFQQAIDAVEKTGGGTLYVPPGSYTCGTIELCSNLVLYLEAGAIVYASNDSSLYRSRPHTDAIQVPMLLLAKGKKNISIQGKGTIAGEPQYTRQKVTPYDFIEKEYAIARAAGLDLTGPKRLVPNITLIFFSECENVSIEGVTIRDSPLWSVHLHWCNDIFVRGIRILSDLENGVNADGLDIDGCRNVVVSDCYISTGDDAIVLKTTNFNGAHRPCEDVTITNCVLESSSSALKLGTESHDDFTRIIFNSCTIRNTNRGLGIFIRDGGTASQIRFSNITMEGTRKDFHWWGDGDLARFLIIKRTPQSRTGAIEQVEISDVMADVQGTSVFTSSESAYLRDIRLRNITVDMRPEATPDKRATNAFTFEKIDGLSLENIAIRWDTLDPEEKWQHAISLDDVRQLNMEDICITNQEVNSNHAAVVIKDVRHASIENIFSPEDQLHRLLNIRGASNERIRLYRIPASQVVIDREGKKDVLYVK